MISKKEKKKYFNISSKSVKRSRERFYIISPLNLFPNFYIFEIVCPLFRQLCQSCSIIFLFEQRLFIKGIKKIIFTIPEHSDS